MDGPMVGVGALIRRGNELLLVLRKNVHGAGSWSTPGGHLEPGESPELCAAREAREETGVEVGPMRFRALTNDVFEREGRHYVTVWMEGTFRSGAEVVAADYELSEVRWFPIDALPEPLFPPFASLVSGRCYPPERGGLR